MSSVVERDLLGVLRTTNPFDIGAYEYMLSTVINEDSHSSSPSSFRLEQSYPNPFNPNTTISYQLPSKIRVTLIVYDILGCEVARLVDSTEDPGYKRVRFDGTGLSSGVYFYMLKAGDFIQTKKLILLK